MKLGCQRHLPSDGTLHSTIPTECGVLEAEINGAWFFEKFEINIFMFEFFGQIIVGVYNIEINHCVKYQCKLRCILAWAKKTNM